MLIKSLLFITCISGGIYISLTMSGSGFLPLGLILIVIGVVALLRLWRPLG